MKLNQMTKGTPRYLTVKLGGKEQFDPKELELLATGAVRCLLPPMAVTGRKNNILQFDITDYSTLKFHLTCIGNKAQFEDVVEQCIDLFRKTKALYMEHKNLVLDFDHVFVSLGSKKLSFVYLPILNYKSTFSYPEFFGRLAKNITCNTYEQQSYMERYRSYLALPTPFSLSEFEAVLHDEAPVGRPTPVPQAYSEPEEGGTVMIPRKKQSGEAPWGMLTRIATDEKIPLQKSEVTLGKDRLQTDYCVADNAAISRRHAQILQDGTLFYVRDLSATNGTFVGGQAVPKGEMLPIADGGTFSLADEEFRFSLECTAAVLPDTQEELTAAPTAEDTPPTEGSVTKS